MKISEVPPPFEMDSKCVYSHGVLNLVTVIAICAVAVMGTVCASFIIYDLDLGLYVFQLLFYPMAIGLIVTFFCSIAELLRNPYMSSIIALIAASVLALLLISSIIVQGVLLGKVYILPFSLL